jgi:alkylation response protein AidB-like acyl-CoA dehydrogenase
MNFEWTEELSMVRESIKRIGATELTVRAAAHDHTPLSYSRTGLEDLGVFELPWDDDDATLHVSILLELARYDSVAAMDVLRASLLESMGARDAALGFHCHGHVIALFGTSGVAFGAEGVWAFKGDGEEARSLGLRAASPVRLESEMNSDALTGSLSGLRLGCASILVGIARAALVEGHRYAQERVQFGKRIADFQGTQFKLAEMMTRVDAAELLALNAAQNKGQSAMALEYAIFTSMYVTDEALQLHGGYGYTSEYAVERHFRDARFLASLCTGII